MKRKFILIIITLTTLCSSYTGIAQTGKEQSVTDRISKRWVLDSIELKDLNRKFPPPENIKSNYAHFKNDGTFESKDNGIVIKGKWRLNLDDMQIINYAIEDSRLPDEIIFTIIEISEQKLAITSKPMSGNQVIMHYIRDKKSQ